MEGRIFYFPDILTMKDQIYSVKAFYMCTFNDKKQISAFYFYSSFFSYFTFDSLRKNFFIFLTASR